MLAVGAPVFAEQVDTAPPRIVSYEIAPVISVLAISDLSFPMPNLQVTRPTRYAGLPALGMSITKPLGRLGDFSFALQATAAFGARSGQLTVLQKETQQITEEEFAVMWIPITAAARLSYRIPGLSFFRPSVTVGFGALTVVQRSELAELSHTSVVPSFVVSPQVTFLDATSFHWLGGFTFGATFYRGLSPTTALNANSIDLGINILL